MSFIAGYYKAINKRDHSRREMTRATLMPSINDIKWHTLFLTVDFPELLFISARTPATAMYMNPPAVNPYNISITHPKNIINII